MWSSEACRNEEADRYRQGHFPVSFKDDRNEMFGSNRKPLIAGQITYVDTSGTHCSKHFLFGKYTEVLSGLCFLDNDEEK